MSSNYTSIPNKKATIFASMSSIEMWKVILFIIHSYFCLRCRW